MIKIIIGTTPTIKYKFKIVKPADIETAILTIIDRTEAHAIILCVNSGMV